MVLWAVLTPLVLFLVLVPGYVVATYVKHRMTISKVKPGRLLGHERVASYCASRPMVRERLQERSRLNVPKAVKRTTKHLRSASSVGIHQQQLPTARSLVVQQPPEKRHHFRRNSSPISVLLTPQHQPTILETYSPYQIQSAPASCDEKSPEETPQKGSDKNNNGKQNGRRGRARHLMTPHSPGHFYTVTGASPFIIPMKMEPVRESLKVDMPELVDKP